LLLFDEAALFSPIYIPMVYKIKNERLRDNMMQYIFINGLGQSASSWDKTISFISKPARIFQPDLKGSTYASLYQSFSDYCNDIPGTLNLCGLSLGAILALNYTVENPEKVQSLVLIAAQYKMPTALLKFQNIIFRFMPKSSFKASGFQKRDFIKLTNSMIDLDFSKKLKDISCPTLIICGEKDNENKKAAENLFEGISNAKIHFVENAGHEVNIEAPEKLATIFDAFWLEN